MLSGGLSVLLVSTWHTLVIAKFNCFWLTRTRYDEVLQCVRLERTLLPTSFVFMMAACITSSFDGFLYLNDCMAERLFGLPKVNALLAERVHYYSFVCDSKP